MIGTSARTTLALLGLALAIPFRADPAPGPARIARLVALARVAEAAHHFHPALDTDSIRWADAEVEAIRRVSEATDDTTAVEAVGILLSELGDSWSRVVFPGESEFSDERGTVQLVRAYAGWPPERGTTSGGFTAFWMRAPEPRIRRFPLPGGAVAVLRLSQRIRGETGAQERVASLGQRGIAWPAVDLPDSAWRILAAFRLWSVLDDFAVTRDSVEGWDKALAEAIPELEAAPDAAAYGRALARMATRFRDSHIVVSSPALWDWYGRATLPVRVRMIEGVPLVVDVADDTLRASGALRVGDEILSVDGEAAWLRLERFRGVRSASNEHAYLRAAAQDLLRGPEGETVHLVVENADGVRQTALPRSVAAWETLRTQRRGPARRVLADSIGYVDLDRIEPDEGKELFESFRSFRVILFDARGVSGGTDDRLSDGSGPVAARFRRPLTTGPSPEDRGATEFVQRVPSDAHERWPGRTAVLVDERTQGQAEHTGLFLRAANGAVLVGSPTAGASGDLTNLTLPGGIVVTFTGQEVRLADGADLQRVGLRPDLPVRPTIAGIRAGRDEVLEAAVRLYRSAAWGHSTFSYGTEEKVE